MKSATGSLPSTGLQRNTHIQQTYRKIKKTSHSRRSDSILNPALATEIFLHENEVKSNVYSVFLRLVRIPVQAVEPTNYLSLLKNVGQLLKRSSVHCHLMTHSKI